MAVDMFINMGDKIKGESKDKAQGPKGDIDVLAWSWGMSQSGSFHVGGGGGSGKVNIQDFSFTKYIDKDSGPLQKHCCEGTHIPKVVLLCRKAGGKQEKYIEITMEKCIITSISTGGSGGEDRLTENVTIDFGKVTFQYYLQDEKGATKDGGKNVWDVEANAGEA